MRAVARDEEIEEEQEEKEEKEGQAGKDDIDTEWRRRRLKVKHETKAANQANKANLFF